jgi:hypothetical protein
MRVRRDVQQLIKAEVEPVGAHGGDHSEQGDIVTLDVRGNAPTYALRRLKRDRPAIYFHTALDFHTTSILRIGTSR